MNPSNVILIKNEKWSKDIFNKEYLHLIRIKQISEIHHVGSTAVPDIFTKPIVDIACLTDDYDSFPKTHRKIIAQGYKFIGSKVYIKDWVLNQTNEYYRFYSKDLSEYAVNLKLMLRNSQQAKDLVIFKEILKKDSYIRREYEQLKLNLQKVYCNDRQAYSEEKNEFITKVLRGYYNGEGKFS